jgi:hypothetical protein
MLHKVLPQIVNEGLFISVLQQLRKNVVKNVWVELCEFFYSFLLVPSRFILEYLVKCGCSWYFNKRVINLKLI